MNGGARMMTSNLRNVSPTDICKDYALLLIGAYYAPADEEPSKVPAEAHYIMSSCLPPASITVEGCPTVPGPFRVFVDANGEIIRLEAD